jgi:hypothetical protein
MAEELTDKQVLFARFYADLLNGTEAARQAGYAGNDNVLAVTAHDNLRNPKIRELVDIYLEERVMSKSEVLARLADQARGSMDDFLTVTGRGFRVDIAKAKRAGKMHLIKKVTKGRQGTSIELYDAQAALALLGKGHRLFVDRLDLEGNVSVQQDKPDLSKLSLDELKQWYELMQKIQGGTAGTE